MCDDAGALRAEVEELSAEVERLRAWQAMHVCAVPGQCTCPASTVAAPAAPRPCPVHSVWTGYVAPYNVCGGAAGVPQTYVWQFGDPPVTMWQPTAGAAGCAATVTYAVPVS